MLRGLKRGGWREGQVTRGNLSSVHYGFFPRPKTKRRELEALPGAMMFDWHQETPFHTVEFEGFVPFEF